MPRRIPSTVEVGPLTFEISTDAAALERWKAKDLVDLGGRYDEATLTITVDGTYAPGFVRETLWHEILHAVFGVTGIDYEQGTDATERLVRRLSPALLELLRRNPELVGYLTADP